MEKAKSPDFETIRNAIGEKTRGPILFVRTYSVTEIRNLQILWDGCMHEFETTEETTDAWPSGNDEERVVILAMGWRAKIPLEAIRHWVRPERSVQAGLR
jgi:hypothetical protein